MTEETSGIISSWWVASFSPRFASSFVIKKKLSTRSCSFSLLIEHLNIMDDPVPAGWVYILIERPCVDRKSLLFLEEQLVTLARGAALLKKERDWRNRWMCDMLCWCRRMIHQQRRGRFSLFIVIRRHALASLDECKTRHRVEPIVMLFLIHIICWLARLMSSHTWCYNKMSSAAPLSRLLL